MKKAIISLTLVVLLSALLTGCCLSHEWADASCSAPKTCTQCGKYEGDTLPHTWQEATCANAQTCSGCGVTEGEALGHTAGTDWEVLTEATTTTDGEYVLKCVVCSEVLESKTYRLPPEEITVLTTDGFVMSETEYHQHLLRYLSAEYTITRDGFSNKLDNGDGSDEVSIYWNEGEKGYQDNVAFLGGKFALEELLEEVIESIDPEVTEDDMDLIMDLWIDARKLQPGAHSMIPLHTGVLVVYNGINGYQAMFCTLEYYLESF